jgi:hypothetical protein
VFRVSKGCALVSSDEETSRKKPKSANRIVEAGSEKEPETLIKEYEHSQLRQQKLRRGLY